MVDRSEWMLWIQTVLTKTFVQLLKRSTVEEINEVSYLDEPTTIYTFRSNGSLFAQATPFGTIIWNEKRAENLPIESKRLVLRHECSHRDRNPVYKGVLYGMSLSFAGGFLGLLLALTLLISGATLLELIVPIGISACMMVTFIVLFRIEETLADYYTIRDLGVEDFIEGYDEISTESDDSLRARIIRKVLYTHPNDTVRLYRFFQQFSNA